MVADQERMPNESVSSPWGLIATSRGRRDGAWGWLMIVRLTDINSIVLTDDRSISQFLDLNPNPRCSP